MPRPRTETKPPTRTKQPASTRAIPGVEASPVRAHEWPEVLTLAEAATYLRVPELEVVRMGRETGTR